MTTEIPFDWETTVVEPFMRVVRRGGFNPVPVLEAIARRSEAFGDGAREMFDELGAEIAGRVRRDRADMQGFNEALKEHWGERRDPVEEFEKAKAAEARVQLYNDAIKAMDRIKEMEGRVLCGATAPEGLGIDLDPPTQTEGETMNPMHDGP